MKAVLIGRHSLLPIQTRMLEKLGIEIVRQVPQVPTSPQEISQFVAQLKAEGVEAIVIQALPMAVLATLLQEAKKHGIKVLTFEQETIFTGSVEEAKKLVEEKPERRTLLTAPNAPARVIEAKAISELTEIKIEKKTLITAEEV